jgi:hypothetical protein
VIRVTVELVPHGDESRARVLARGTITNDGTGTFQRGNYRFWLSQSGRPNTATREGAVTNFPRQAKNVWHLLAQCLNTAFGPKEA